jgi:DNA-binding beta-propeller fold protein YncE
VNLPLIALFLFQAGTAAPVPQRVIRDPGFIATGQRVTPAGVQSVFEGKVGGVRFGATTADIWVAVPGYLYRVDWRSNSARAVKRVDGRSGIFSLAVDSVAHRIFASSVGRLPVLAAPGTGRRPSVAQLSAFDLNATGDSTGPALNSGGVGDFMAGSPAIAARPGAEGKRLAVLPLPANDALAVTDADRGTLLQTIPLGVEPIAAVISSDSRTAYVSILGGAKPRAAQRGAAQCCDAHAEAVRIDARGIALGGSVSRVDLSTGAVSADIPAGRHPTGLAWDEKHDRLFVIAGNADSITIIDTQTDHVIAQFAIAPFRERQIGLSPTALALSPDRRTLYVALGGVNAVAVYDVSSLRGDIQLRGLIPTAWYPSALDVSSDGQYIAVGSLFGLGAGIGSVGDKRSRYVFATRGSVHVVATPTSAELTAYSTAVSQNNRLSLTAMPAASVPPPARVARAVPARPGDPSLIGHVVFIVKENRTYDQVLGDLDRGSRDSSLVEYGRDVTPNTHALSRQFVTLDHFFASGGNSADGHQWLTQANETEYPMWPLYYGRSYPSEGIDPLTYSSGGFLWEAARAKGRTVSIFGEYAPAPKVSSDTIRRRMMAQYLARPSDFSFHRQVLAARFDTRSEIPSLDRDLVREYPGWTEEVPDVMKAGDVLSHLGDWERSAAMPDLVMIVLPNDHTQGTSPGWCTPKACVADNDYALGKIVDGLSHSSFWKDMAILAVEDDAQNGVDHVDGHRTVALAISPYARRGIVDSTSYGQPSMVKTVELMLGLPAMSIFDLVATDMRASFIDAGERADLTPYTALEPVQSLLDVNPPAAGIRGRYSVERRRAARASARMSFDGPDEAPADALNRILWHDARGWDIPYPARRRSLFFPQSVDIADEDRRVKPARP